MSEEPIKESDLRHKIRTVTGIAQRLFPGRKIFDEENTVEKAAQHSITNERGTNYARSLDQHRLSAHGEIDRELETGKITPSESIERKRIWDLRHGF